jgi:hypothetical protein
MKKRSTGNARINWLSESRIDLEAHGFIKASVRPGVRHISVGNFV